MIRAVAVDMDGTFLRSDSTYDRPRFMRLVERLREADVRFIAASGNQAARLRHYFEDDPRVSYVAENGHYVYEGATNVPLYAAPPLGDGGRSIVRALESVGSPCVVSTRQGALMPSWAAGIGLDWARRHFLNLRVVADLYAHSGEIVAAAVNTTEPHETALTFERLLVDIVEVVVSGPADLDLNSPGHSKATGLAHLLKSWGLGLPELVAIGDSLNDMDMLRAAGTAVAVANAHPRILAIADHMAPTNDLGGALDVLEWVLSHA